MIEKLLHAQIVLSKDDVTRLSQAGVKGMLGAEEGTVGRITFLGTDNIDAKTIYLLLRFEEGQYGVPLMPIVIQGVFRVTGRDFIVMYGNSTFAPGSEPRALITMRLEQGLLNPAGFIRGKAKQFAKALVQAHWRHIRFARNHPEDED